jgi:hypothetical protein
MRIRRIIPRLLGYSAWPGQFWSALHPRSSPGVNRQRSCSGTLTLTSTGEQTRRTTGGLLLISPGRACIRRRSRQYRGGGATAGQSDHREEVVGPVLG